MRNRTSLKPWTTEEARRAFRESKGGTMLIDGKEYKDKRGNSATIGGTCKDYPDWCWSIQANWYERSTGKAIAYRNFGSYEKPDWRHVVESSPRDLIVEEI